jgi:hypothetical protein
MSEAKPWDPSWRQRLQQGVQAQLEKAGMPRYRAIQYSERFTGGSSNAIGAADFVPLLGAGLGFDEGTTQVGDGVGALQRGQVGSGLLDIGLGSAVAAASVIPGAAKPASVVSKKISKAVKGKAPEVPVVRTPEEKAVLDKFGQKHEREAALEKKVAKANAASEAEEEAAVRVGKKATRKKTEADVFRDMERNFGQEATLANIRKGQHLKPDGRGGYVGAPRTVTSPQALGALRRELDNQFGDAVQAVDLAERRAGTPERVGTWYDRAKQGIAESNEPWQLDRSLDGHSVYSAGVSPESELGFSLKHDVSRAIGMPDMAYRGAPMRTLDKAVKNDTEPKLGFKIGEYRDKNDPRLPNEGLFGVNDFRRAQGMGYTLPDGSIWQGGVSPTMHPFMDGETALQVDRARKGSVAGRADWQGPHIQELPWVYDKGQDLYFRGQNARYKGDPLEGITSALRDANNTARDYFYKHTASATHEAIPGKSTGHVPSLLDADPQAKLNYSQTGRWDIPTPYLLDDAPTVGEGPRDALYSAIGLRQLPSVQSTGAYLNSAGNLETNPMTIARPMLDFPTGGGGGRIAPNRAGMMDATERFRAVVDAQEAGGYNLPNTMDSVTGKNAMVIDTRGAADPTTGRQPTADQLRQTIESIESASAAAAKEAQGLLDVGPPTSQAARKLDRLNDAAGGYGVTATSRGALVFPYNPTASGGGIDEIMRRAGPGLQSAFPGAKAEKAVASTGYVPGIGKWDGNNVVPTQPYTGEATMGLLEEMAFAPNEVARKISESEAVRNIIREKITRDAALPGARGDIQNTRNFLAEADWNKAVEMIRRGVPAAAALSALGYSASSLAAEPDR